ncbi:hypothetical protein [Paraburkholderia bannensis]|uniref:hypothetical protein n=1 Tax=Paraburkholderia bannensis TaxID=765414 RepID=UPI002AB7F291|nr:hypothetical protein [Paraburkholderia bannensis]
MSIESAVDGYEGFASYEHPYGLYVQLLIDRGSRGVAALEIINRDLAKPFGEVPLAMRALAFALWQDGWPVEFRNERDEWHPTDQPLWGPRMVYRLGPHPESFVLPSIDWSHVSADFKWLAQDESGAAYLVDRKPSGAASCAAPGAGRWSYAGIWSRADLFTSFKRGSGDWRKLIVQRPEGA